MLVAGSGGNLAYEENQVVTTEVTNSHNLVFLVNRFSSASCNRHLGDNRVMGQGSAGASRGQKLKDFLKPIKKNGLSW